MTDALSIRVALRYARNVRAGVFEAPAAMMASVGDWIRSVYAAHVLADVETRIENMRDRIGVLDRQIAGMQASLASCERDIKDLKPDKSVRYQTWVSPVEGFHQIGVRRRKDSYLKPGERTLYVMLSGSKPGPGLVPACLIGRGKNKLEYGYESFTPDEAIEKIKIGLKAGIDRLEAFKSKHSVKPINGPRLVESILLKRECLKYATGAKAYAAKATRKFPIDLTGWKYLRPGSNLVARINERIEEKNAQVYKQIEVAEKTFDLALKAYDLAKKLRDWEKSRQISAILDKLDGRWLDEWPHDPVWDDYRVRGAIYTDTRPQEPMGWLYVGGRSVAAPIADLKKTIEPPLGPQDIMRALTYEGWSEITVQLDFIGHKKTLGTWNTNARTLDVDIRGDNPTTVADFNEILDDILRTLRHELQHMGQDILTRIHGLKQEAGTPSQDIREPAPTDKKRKEHALREEEFYTRLADEIEDFVKFVRRRDPATYKEVFQWWVNQHAEFFRMLKQHEPLKWEKAVKEFIKGINAKGIEV